MLLTCIVFSISSSGQYCMSKCTYLCVHQQHRASCYMSDGALTVKDLSLDTHENQRTKSFFTQEKVVLFGNGSGSDNMAFSVTWWGIM